MYYTRIISPFLYVAAGPSVSRLDAHASWFGGVHEGTALAAGQLRSVRGLPQLRIERRLNNQHSISRQARNITIIYPPEHNRDFILVPSLSFI